MTAGRARALLTVAMGLWGLQFVANHELLEVITATDIVVVRFIAVVVLVAGTMLAVPSLRPRLGRRDVAILVAAGALAVPGSQLTLAHGQNYLAPAMAGLVVATQPAVTAALSALVLRERMSARRVMGMALALAGAAVVVVLATGQGTELTVRNPWGAALVFAAQVSFACYTVMTKAVQGRMHPLTLTFSGLLFGAVWLIPLVPGALGDVGALEGLRWLWFVQLVVGGTLFPYIVWNLALGVLPASEVGAYTFLIPLFGISWSWLILREDLSPVGLAGGALIVVGVVLTRARPRPDAQHAPAGSATRT